MLLVAWRLAFRILLRLSRRGRSWVLGECQHADLPSITLTDFNRPEVAPELMRATVLALKKNRTTAFSVFPDGIAICTYKWTVRPIRLSTKNAVIIAYYPIILIV